VRAGRSLLVCLSGALLAQAPYEIHLNRGTEAMRTRRFDAAIREFTRAIALSPRSGRAHLLLGEAYLATGEPGFLAVPPITDRV
jgi:Flp pilus assembly protein TadD